MSVAVLLVLAGQFSMTLSATAMGHTSQSTQGNSIQVAAPSCAQIAAEMTSLAGRVGGIAQERQATASAGQPDVVGDTALAMGVGALGSSAPNAVAPLLNAPLDARQRARQRANDRANEYEARTEPEFTSGLDRLEQLNEAYQQQC